jgi:uncharacterized membrane protein YdbT with pleckstrin-like domain
MMNQPETNEAALDPRGRILNQMAAGASPDKDREQELWRGGYSAKAMIPAWIGAGLLTIAMIVVGVMFQIWMVTIPIAAAVWVVLFLKLLYERLSVHYILSSQRFVHEKGILNRVVDRIETIDMDDITITQNLIERMIGVGSVRITSSDRTHPQMVMRGIDNVREVAGMMDDARRKERVRRGIHIEAV